MQAKDKRTEAIVLGFRVALFSAAMISACPAVAQVRGEIHAGYNHLQAADGNIDGAVFGLGIGYDHVVNGVLGGVEANFDASSGETCQSSLLLPGDQACVEPRRDVSILARIGIVTAPRSVVYLSFGYANLQLRGTYQLGNIVERETETLHGGRLAVGYQQGFGGSWYGKAEYRYSNYEAGISGHQTLLGIGIRF